MRSEVASSVCAICQSPMRDGEDLVSCPSCHAPFHAECWEENGGCAIYGCELVPKVGMRSGMEIPATFWGQENKPCPSCGMEILAAAVRCRHCGATFASAQPENAETFRRRAERAQSAPALRQRTVWLFIFCVLPFTAPIASVILLIWSAAHREEIKALPAFNVGLVRIALIVGLGQTVIAVLMATLFAVFRGH